MHCKYKCKDQRGRKSPLFILTIVRVEEKIRRFLEEIISDQPELFVVKVSLAGKVGDQILRIAMDGDQGITVDLCASISRQLGSWIEETDLITDKYRLEVSSAGLETPLKMDRQYAKNVGRKIKVSKRSGETIEGKLAGYDGQVMDLEVNEKVEKIEVKEIEKSVIMISFK